MVAAGRPVATSGAVAALGLRGLRERSSEGQHQHGRRLRIPSSSFSYGSPIRFLTTSQMTLVRTPPDRRRGVFLRSGALGAGYKSLGPESGFVGAAVVASAELGITAWAMFAEIAPPARVILPFSSDEVRDSPGLQRREVSVGDQVRGTTMVRRIGPSKKAVRANCESSARQLTRALQLISSGTVLRRLLAFFGH